MKRAYFTLSLVFIIQIGNLMKYSSQTSGDQTGWKFRQMVFTLFDD